MTQFSRITRDEIFAYAPFVNFILKGNIFLQDAYTKEYSKSSTPFIGETIPSLVFAAIAKLTGSIENSFLAADFIFPPIIFLFLYMFLRLFIKNKLFALSVAFLTVMMRDIISVIPYPAAVFNYLVKPDDQLYPLIFSRSFHPQLTFIIFLSTVISIFKLIQRPTKMLIITTGILYGLLFYSYVFYWTYFSVFLALTFLYLIFKKDTNAVYSITKVGLIALSIGSFYFYNMFKFYQLDSSADFTARTALEGQPLPQTAARYLAIALAFFISFRNNGQKYLLLSLFLLTGLLIPISSKFIIGADLETLHYLRRALMPFATMALFILMFKLFENKKQFTNVLSVLIVLTTLLFTLKSQMLARENVIADYKIDGDEKFVYDWLKRKTEKDDVVGSLNIAFNLGLPVFTNNKTYFPRMDRTVMPTKEGVERFITLSTILGVSKNQQHVLINKEIVLSYIFAYQAYSKGIGLDLNSPRKISTENKINEFQKEDLSRLSKTYAYDYIVVTPNELDIVKPSMQLLAPMTSINEYIIFKKK